MKIIYCTQCMEPLKDCAVVSHDAASHSTRVRYVCPVCGATMDFIVPLLTESRDAIDAEGETPAAARDKDEKNSFCR